MRTFQKAQKINCSPRHPVCRWSRQKSKKGGTPAHCLNLQRKSTFLHRWDLPDEGPRLTRCSKNQSDFLCKCGQCALCECSFSLNTVKVQIKGERRFRWMLKHLSSAGLTSFSLLHCRWQGRGEVCGWGLATTHERPKSPRNTSC